MADASPMNMISLRGWMIRIVDQDHPMFEVGEVFYVNIDKVEYRLVPKRPSHWLPELNERELSYVDGDELASIPTEKPGQVVFEAAVKGKQHLHATFDISDGHGNTSRHQLRIWVATKHTSPDGAMHRRAIVHLRHIHGALVHAGHVHADD
jgi:hypothetical protein